MDPTTFVQLQVQISAAETCAEQARTKEDALKATLDAAELCMQALRLPSNTADKSHINRRCRILLDQAEDIKSTEHTRARVWKSPLTKYPSVPDSRRSSQLKTPCSNRQLSTREQIILLEGSKLHGCVFPPWTSPPGDSAFDLPDGQSKFVDDFDYQLSDTQLEVFDGWLRPHEILRPPDSAEPNSELRMKVRGCMDLTQDITADCSVVASLCAVTARSERRHLKFLPSIVYPFDYSTMEPGVSRNGKYVLKLQLNGCYRQIVIDDRLPTSKTSRSLFVTDRNNNSIIWPALVEKAYLKARGGYNLPGSNSGTDLWILTGWIPEQLFLQSDEIDRAALWLRVSRAFAHGNVLITMGTGRLTESEEDAMGLVGEHDYAIIDLQEDQGRRLLLIKNPWSKASVWKGSTAYTRSVTNMQCPNKKETTNPTVAQTHALMPGTFWMDLNDIFQNFESMYLNWNLSLFSVREDIHFAWDLLTSRSPPGSFWSNPQFEVRTNAGGVVWLLLGRHFRSRHTAATGEQFDKANATHGFISLYAYENNGERVFESDNALVHGTYVDSPNTLLKLELVTATAYTIVVSEQALPPSMYNFTLSAFSNEQLTLHQARDKYAYRVSKQGAWTVSSSGGHATMSTYGINPSFSIHLTASSSVALLLETGDENLPVHVKLIRAHGGPVRSITTRDIVGDSGEYTKGYAFAELEKVDPGTYTIVCSTFERGQYGEFRLNIGTMCPCTINRVPAAAAGCLVSNLKTSFSTADNNRVVAPLFLTRLTRLRVLARWCRDTMVSLKGTRSPLRVTLEYGQGAAKSILAASGDGDFADSHLGLETAYVDLPRRTCQQGDLWVVVERIGCTAAQNGTEHVDIDILSDAPIEVGQWRPRDE